MCMRLENIINIKNEFFAELYKKLGIQTEDNNENHTIQTFESFLAKQDKQKPNQVMGEKAIKDFIIQVEFYQKHDLCFGIIDESNIYIIDEDIFFIKADISPIVDKYYINIDMVYSKTNIYLPPELRDNNELPFKTRNTLCFYSIGKIIHMLLFHSIELEREKIHKMLGNTQLFFCLDRATKENPNHRYLIYI